MQKPHCTAPQSMYACCSGWSASRFARPSIVVITEPCAAAAGTKHDITAAPSSHTVHAPHSPSAQPSLVPVKPASRRAFSSVFPPASSSVLASPLIVASTAPANGPAGGRGGGAGLQQYRLGGEAVGFAAVGQPLETAETSAARLVSPVGRRAPDITDRRGVVGGRQRGGGAARGIKRAADERRFGAPEPGRSSAPDTRARSGRRSPGRRRRTPGRKRRRSPRWPARGAALI